MTTRLGPRDPAYPRLLAAMAAPPSLHVCGTITAEDTLAVAIVGSRRATPYGVVSTSPRAPNFGEPPTGSPCHGESVVFLDASETRRLARSGQLYVEQ